MSAVAQKLFALGQGVAGDSHFQPSQRNSSYRPSGVPQMAQMQQNQGQNGMGAVGEVAGRAIGEGLKSYMKPSAAPVPDTLSVENAMPAIQQGAAGIGAGLGAQQMPLPDASTMGFGQSPQAAGGIMSMFSGLFGG